jgi:hypothetical protein
VKQSKIMSLVESVINIVVGFGISLAAQIYFLPLLGVQISLSQNVTFALIMTVVSIARSQVERKDARAERRLAAGSARARAANWWIVCVSRA